MKKYNGCECQRWQLHKFLLTMKLLCVFILIGFFSVSATESYSQSTRIDLNVKNATLKSILNQIEEKTEFYFFYKNEEIKDLTNLSVEANKASVSEVLDNLLEGKGFEYEVFDRYILIQKEGGNLTVEKQMQQEGRITGKVSDKAGIGLPGVTVLVKGTNKGVITNTDGEFTISSVAEDDYLQFSFVGMKTQEVAVSGKSYINVTMEEDMIGIDEVVAIGYGTMKKSDLTGSVISVDLARKDMAANVDISQALQGYLPGVNATAGSLAGQEGVLSIRGQTSFSTDSDPLIVRDGIIFNGSLSEINMNDVEKIDILKDASAAAVYGSRAANGVIIITTKKGKSEKPVFNFNTYFGFQQLDNTVKDQVMNGEQYAQKCVDYIYTQTLNQWYKTGPTSADDRPTRLIVSELTDKTQMSSYFNSDEEYQNFLKGNETNWMDVIFRTAPIQSYSLSVSGKTERTNYYLSGSYMDQDGIIENDQFNRSTVNLNLDNQITSWMNLGVNASYSHLDYSGTNADLGAASSGTPWGNYYDSEGNIPRYLADEAYMPHPLATSVYEDNVNVMDRLYMTVTGLFTIPWVKGLSYELTYSKYLDFEKNNTFTPSVISSYAGYARKLHTEENNWTVNNIITYSREFDKHKINATLLYTREYKHGETSELIAYDFSNETLGYNAMEMGTTQKTSSGAWKESSLAYMGRINYAYNNRYLLTGTIRKDGYSGFGANKKYGYFPSVSAGWVVSEEDFMKSIDPIDYMKFRVSYGVNGNQGIGRYKSLSQMSSNYYNYDGNVVVGLYSSTLGNSDLGWERTASFNIGLDFGIIDHRISGSVDVYKAKTTDVLVERTLSGSTGYTSVWANLGGVNNKGIEFSLSTTNIENGDFTWKSQFAFSLNRNEITDLYGDGTTEDLGNGWFVGENINSIYGYVNAGVWQEEDLFNGTIYDGYLPGQYKIEDLSGEDGVPDGQISADYDRKIQGSTDPNYRFSLNNIFTYKNISFSFFLNSIQGGNGYYQGGVSYVAGGTDSAYRTNRTAIKPYWTPQNPTNDTPAIYYSAPKYPTVLEDRSFVRLQDVTLAYTFNRLLISKYGINSAQVYLSGKNLYKWTDCSDWDPERSSPMMRSIIAGVKLSF